MPLSAIDFNTPIFKLDPETLMIQGDPSRAVYPALIGPVIRLVSTLALFASPYVSDRIASGQVFEGVWSDERVDGRVDGDGGRG